MARVVSMKERFRGIVVGVLGIEVVGLRLVIAKGNHREIVEVIHVVRRVPDGIRVGYRIVLDGRNVGI